MIDTRQTKRFFEAMFNATADRRRRLLPALRAQPYRVEVRKQPCTAPFHGASNSG